MENKTLSMAPSVRYIPEELLIEILYRVPVKSLLRFCCVSKSWISLIKDPDFRRLHLNNFKNNRYETHLLVAEGKEDMQQQCVVRCSNTFVANTETILSLGRNRTGVGSWDVFGSVDGLVLLRSCNRGLSGFKHLMLWNPSIRKFRNIPPLPEMGISPGRRGFREAEIGMCYDPLVKDYKHVKLILGKSNVPPFVAVYTLGADSWKIIPFQGEVFSKFSVWNFIFFYMKPSENAVYLRGSFYFITRKTSENDSKLVSFDLSNEVPDLFYLKKNNDMLIQWCRQGISMPPTDPEFVEQWRSMVLLYNHDMEKKKILMQDPRIGCKTFDIHGYIESLILLK